MGKGSAQRSGIVKMGACGLRGGCLARELDEVRCVKELLELPGRRLRKDAPGDRERVACCPLRCWDACLQCEVLPDDVRHACDEVSEFLGVPDALA